jgi:hypothetical protein
VGKALECRIESRDCELRSQSFDTKTFHLMPQNGFGKFWSPNLQTRTFGPEISKLGPATKMGHASHFLYFFHQESTNIDENYIMIHSGSISLPLYFQLAKIFPFHFKKFTTTLISSHKGYLKFELLLNNI